MFSPYHKFTNCQKLRRIINDLKKSNRIPQDLWAAHNTYHYTLIHKLKSAQHYVGILTYVLSNTSPQDITSEFILVVNRNVDGFFYSGGSALDILAREVLTCFDIQLPTNVYFKTAREELTQHRPGDPIIRCLGDPRWKNDFSTYRNVLTHELLIVGTSITVNMNIDGTSQDGMLVPLPDNPRSNPSQRTYRRYPDVGVYCKTTLFRLLSLINIVYGELADRIAQSNRLPL